MPTMTFMPFGRGGHRARPFGNPTRVLFLHTATRPPLGADTWIHAQIMRGLSPSTHELHAACVTGPANEPTPTCTLLRVVPGVRIHPVHLGSERKDGSVAAALRWLLGSLRAVAGLTGLAWYVRRHRIDLVHTSDRPRDAWTAVVLARLTGAKSIVHVHVGYGEWMSSLLKWALKRADALIAISSFVAGTLTASGHDQDRTHVVRNGIDPSPWVPGDGRDEARREFGAGPETIVVVTVCRLFPEKGPGDLIRAVAAVTKEYPDVLVLVVGKEMTPGYAAELKALADGLGLADRVRLTGRRDDVARIMAGADIYAMPSFEEPFGLVFLEAMGMELPVVALDSGGAPEVVQDGLTGLLSPPGDVEALADNLSMLIGDGEQRRVLGKRGRERFLTEFTNARMANDVARVYRNLRSLPANHEEGRT